MRVIHVTPRYFPNVGGVEVFVKELCEGLSAKGFDTAVYTLDLENALPPNKRINGVTVRRYRSLIGDPAYIPPFRFINDLRRETSAIIHVHNLQTLLPLLLSMTLKRGQILILHPHYHRFGQTTTRNAILSLCKDFAFDLALTRAQAIIANSPYEKKTLQEDFLLKNNIVLVPQGLPLDELRMVRWRPEYPDRILFVGSLKKYKGVDKLLHAFKLLLELEKENLKLVIVGDGPEKCNLFKLAGELGIRNNVIWKQNLSRSQLLSEYSKARVFVSLSALESFSRVVYEAMAIGLPTVVFGVGIFSDIVNEGLAEGIFSPHPSCIAKALLHAKETSTSPQCRKKTEFQDIASYVNQIAKIYTSLGA
jgi:glycosyltransferase involved in cell wall biosynthesis